MSQECLELIEKALLNLVRGLSTEASFKAAVRELGLESGVLPNLFQGTEGSTPS